MAALTGNQISLMFSDSVCDKSALFALKNVTAGDTVDLAQWFSVVKRAGIVGATVTTIAAVGTITGNTVCTVPAGPANDGIWLLVYGVGS